MGALVQNVSAAPAPGLFGSCPTPKTNDTVNLQAYMGRWYQIAASAKFVEEREKDMGCIIAEYSMEGDHIKVNNTGYSPEGKRDTAIGKAKQVSGGHLKVSFFGTFYGPYDIIDLYGAAPYEVAVIYSCSTTPFFGQEDLWILSRTPELPAGMTIESLSKVVTAQGVDVAKLKLIPTLQNAKCPYNNA